MNDEINVLKEKKGTTVYLEQDAYSMILEKQMKLFKDTNKRVPIQELVSDFIKKGSKIDEFDETYLKNLIYKNVMKIFENKELIYKGNSHHLTQNIVEKISSDIMSQLKE